VLMARNDEKQHKVYHTCSTIRSDANGDDHKTRLQRGYVTKCVCWSNMAGLDLQGGAIGQHAIVGGYVMTDRLQDR
jgi:hypothetical protein